MGKFKKEFMTKVYKLFEPVYRVERFTVEDGYASDTIIVLTPKHENADTEDDFYHCLITMPMFGDDDQENDSIVQMIVTAIDYIENDNEPEFLSALNYINYMSSFCNFNMNPMDRSVICKYSQFLSDKDNEEGNLSRTESSFALMMTELMHFSGVLNKVANGTLKLDEAISSGEIF